MHCCVEAKLNTYLAIPDTPKHLTARYLIKMLQWWNVLNIQVETPFRKPDIIRRLSFCLLIPHRQNRELFQALGGPDKKVPSFRPN